MHMPCDAHDVEPPLCGESRIRPSGTKAQPRTAVPTWPRVTQGFVVFFAFAWLLLLLSCSRKPEADTLVMIIESSPTNLDPRVGLDAQSENIDGLLFDNLLARDEHLSVKPGLAERWEIPDPKTYIFHLRAGIKFCDGRPLTSRDVQWSFDSLLQGKVRSTKAATYRFVEHIAGRLDSSFPSKRALGGLSVECGGRRGNGGCALRKRQRNEPTTRRLGAFSLRSR